MQSPPLYPAELSTRSRMKNQYVLLSPSMGDQLEPCVCRGVEEREARSSWVKALLKKHTVDRLLHTHIPLLC